MLCNDRQQCLSKIEYGFSIAAELTIDLSQLPKELFVGGRRPSASLVAAQERIRRLDESVVVDLGEAVLVGPPEVARRGGVEEVAQVRGARAVVGDLRPCMLRTIRIIVPYLTYA